MQVFIGVAFVLWLVLAQLRLTPRGLAFLLQIPLWIVQYFLHCRIRRRVEAKVAAELRDGRLWKCVECDYDLRASEERCPECAAPVHVRPPAEAT